MPQGMLTLQLEADPVGSRLRQAAVLPARKPVQREVTLKVPLPIEPRVVTSVL